MRSAPLDLERTTVDPRTSEYDAKIAKYRAALEASADPKLVTTWIAEAQAARQWAHALRPKPSPRDDDILRLTAADLERILDQLSDLVAVLRDADPDQKLDLYRALGLQLTYQPDTRTGARRSRSWRAPLGFGWCPRPDVDLRYAPTFAHEVMID